MQAGKLLRYAVLGALCVTGAIAVVVLLSGSFDETSWRILGTTSAISFFGLLAVPAGMLLERGRAVALARISAALTGAAFLLTVALIWRHWENGIGKTWAVVLTLSVAAAQAAVVEARRRDTDTPTISLLTAGSMVTGAVLTGMGVYAILAEADDGTYYRALGAIAVIDLLLLAMVAVLRREAGPSAQSYRMRVNGELVEAPGRDFATAVASVIREAEKDGKAVQRIERA